MKRTIIVTVLLVIAIVCVPVSAAEKTVDVFLNGKLLDFGKTNGRQDGALIINGYTYVPIAKIVEVLTGSPPNWDAKTKTASFTFRDKKYDIVTSKTGIYRDGAFIKSDAPPVIVNDRTLVPLRMLTAAMGLKIDYDGSVYVYDATGLIYDFYANPYGSGSGEDNVFLGEAPHWSRAKYFSVTAYDFLVEIGFDAFFGEEDGVEIDYYTHKPLSELKKMSIVDAIVPDERVLEAEFYKSHHPEVFGDMGLDEMLEMTVMDYREMAKKYPEARFFREFDDLDFGLKVISDNCGMSVDELWFMPVFDLYLMDDFGVWETWDY
jgi:hypothetical protein